ncbi:MAG: hypothetical protein GTN80_06450 [Nitrososphaeria archaeon]|nr:hypothetical protein [Nitrososphaeria archaeon]NIQ33267.1 hypothetical protein [Nitrososphaeria archaeon]
MLPGLILPRVKERRNEAKKFGRKLIKKYVEMEEIMRSAIEAADQTSIEKHP